MIGLCTDSGAQLPRALAERFGIVVVPITVDLDGHEYLEGVDLDTDDYYRRFAGGAHPAVRLVEPSPGQFALAYEELADRGCDAVLSVHSGRSTVATLNPARLAAHRSPVPIRVVDSGAPGVAITGALWRVAEALVGGLGIDEATELAESSGAHTDHVFVVAAHDLVVAGHPVPVFAEVDGAVSSIGEARDSADLTRLVVEHAGRRPGPVRVAIGLADRAGRPVVDALVAALGDAPGVDDVVVYRIGPSAGARLGPGGLDVSIFEVGGPVPPARPLSG